MSNHLVPLAAFIGIIIGMALPLSAGAALLPTVDVRTYGAVGDGTTVDTQAVQKAVDRCSAQGGATLVFPAGNYVIGTIILKDNVHLSLVSGAALLGNTDAADYHALQAFTDGTGQTLGFCLIGASGAKNVGVEGSGTIDGRGGLVMQGQAGSEPKTRPFLMRWVGCRGVTVSGVRLQNPAAWTLNFFQCRDCVVSSVAIRSHGQANNDGMDLDSCQGMQVTNCDIDSGDDALCLKATSPEPCRNITASGCTLKSNCGAIKFGTESLGDFQDIRITDCKITGGGLGGIKLLSVDGAHLEDVVISGITMTDVHVPIFVRLGARLRTFHAGQTARPVGTIRNVTLRNIKAAGTGIGVLVSGIPGHSIEDLTLDNVTLTLPGGGVAAADHKDIAENEAAYPEVSMFGDSLPASGVFARHVSGLTLHHVTVILDRPDMRPLEVSENAPGLTQEPSVAAAP